MLKKLILQYDYFVEQNEAGQWEEHIGFIVVLEPSSALLALGGLVGMLARRRRRIGNWFKTAQSGVAAKN